MEQLKANGLSYAQIENKMINKLAKPVNRRSVNYVLKKKEDDERIKNKKIIKNIITILTSKHGEININITSPNIQHPVINNKKILEIPNIK